jgi:hypothetical protein
MRTHYTTRSLNLSAFAGLPLFVLLLLLPACKKFVDVKNSRTELPETIVFEREQSAISATVALYAKMNDATFNIFCGGTSVFAGLWSDELVNTTTNATYDPFLKNQLLSNNSTINSRFWSRAYPIIYQANAIVEGLQRSKTVSDSVRNQLTGEAKLVRAFTYLNLVNLFGEVPLALTTDYRINSTLPRTSVYNVYQQIENDLREAAQLLPPVIINGSGRPNKWVAKALLASVYLYEKKYMQAESEASEVIGCGLYALTSNLNNVFTVNSREIIWQIMPVGTAQLNSPEGNIFIPSSASSRPTFVLSNQLLSAFENGDLRKSSWTKTVFINNVSYTYPYKYKLRTNASIAEANVVLRLAEQYLIRAEARAYTNKVTGNNSAESDLNVIRSRAGLPNTTAIALTEMVDAIVNERQTELFTEWGHRWFDLKRLDRVNTVLGVNKAPGWDAADLVWPIPISEMNLNVFLTQNPGY